MEKIILTRKELYDLVWSNPVAVLLRKYDFKYFETNSKQVALIGFSDKINSFVLL